MPPAMPVHASQIDIRVHGDFSEWLVAANGTLAVTTYNSGRLALVSAPAGRLTTRFVRLARPMGVAFDGVRLAVAAREQIHVWRLADNLPPQDNPVRFAKETTHATGRLDVHDLAFDARGLCFANTRFNCLARPGRRSRFRRAWTPSFLTASATRDCCHLNGLGVRGGRLAVATAFCTSSMTGGWRTEDRFQSGVAIDVRRNRVAVSGLCMPHSPRWDGRTWWLCNSGEGTLCAWDPRGGVCEAVAFLPGFTRGLCFAAGRAVVGLSRIRRRHILDAPPVRQRHPRLRSGAWLVDPVNGRTTGALEFVRGGREVYDVAFLPGVTHLDLPSTAAS
jgi:uncharacterized protein (TIGR03032 family)